MARPHPRRPSAPSWTELGSGLVRPARNRDLLSPA
jgi:hypothetical protein